MDFGSKEIDIRQSLTRENPPSWGPGQAILTLAGNTGIEVWQVMPAPGHVSHRDCNLKKKRHSTDCVRLSMLQLETLN